ncbi:MAG: phosphate ABC transporter substrate-binding protein PstS, partial [Chitinivibrionales bacterium]|nr:phosphate ABC transporter substrate-binding protein PstS [Chitinivibrionales bacterium]MBD3356319.1 phosphate ABC transporter substrate-binding protein PstS [Chitinivibrionales bacterium]
MLNTFRGIRAFVVAGAAIALCSTGAKAADGLLGAGATFPYPLYSKMFDVYHKKYGMRINYQSIGSGGGIRQLESKTIDFGATDAFMSDTKLEKIPQKIVHIPMCLGA